MASMGGVGWVQHPLSMLLVGVTAGFLLLQPAQRIVTADRSPAESVVEGLVGSDNLDTLVRELLAENPDIIVSALARFQQQQAESQQQNRRAIVQSRQSELLDETILPPVGNPNADVTIVEFIDYQCGFCKRAHPMIQRLIAEDGNVKLIYKQFPILGPASVYAGRAALAARAQGKFVAFHDALMEARVRLSEAVVMRIAEDVGLDIDRLRRDMESNAQEHQAIFVQTQDLARALGIQGTPSFVIDGAMISGFVDEAGMRSLIEDARRNLVALSE